MSLNERICQPIMEKYCSDDFQGSPVPIHSPPHLLLRASCWARFSYIMRMARWGISEIKKRDLEISFCFTDEFAEVQRSQATDRPGGQLAARPAPEPALPAPAAAEGRGSASLSKLWRGHCPAQTTVASPSPSRYSAATFVLAKKTLKGHPKNKCQCLF